MSNGIIASKESYNHKQVDQIWRNPPIETTQHQPHLSNLTQHPHYQCYEIQGIIEIHAKHKLQPLWVKHYLLNDQKNTAINDPKGLRKIASYLIITPASILHLNLPTLGACNNCPWHVEGYH